MGDYDKNSIHGSVMPNLVLCWPLHDKATPRAGQMFGKGARKAPGIPR